MMLQAGVPLGEAALWLGHSVETLVSTYVGALQGDDVVAMERVDTAFEGQMVTWVLGGCWLLPRANGGPDGQPDVALAC